jgi:hypothetical protein
MLRALEAWSVCIAMYARAVDDASVRLRELRREEWEDFGLAALTIGLALGATEVRPAFAVPLLLGGMWIGARGVRALWRGWDLVDRLADDRDAYVIPEVLAYAAREATMERRHSYAALIRSRLREPGLAVEARIQSATGDLEALATDLEDETRVLAPASGVACMRLLTDLACSPLLNPALPPDDLRSRVHQIRSGFHDPRLATGA